MSENRQNLLFRIQLLAILVFFIGFLIWANTKCTRMREQYRDQWEVQQALEEAKQDSLEALQAIADSIQATATPPASSPSANLLREKYTPLFVTIEGLNLRDTPGLEGEVLVKLNLYEEVEFLNEVTDSTTQLSLGKVTANEPWIKVRSKKGHVGWVYGAGVHYYKRRQEGAI